MPQKNFVLTNSFSKKARMLAIAGDNTRIRILAFMFENKKACVSSISEALGMSISAISHHLQLMRDNGFFTTERIGNMICYVLTESKEMKKLRSIICE